ncbi:uncharacterized protein LOC141802825 [Halichoeres trimaculatus]|uniref:uncharacterized protein LOC141802825 n=1 Tax=Halichoeres trimaculatus TaxID=147232 RepID=UPI003D9DB8BB
MNKFTTFEFNDLLVNSSNLRTLWFNANPMIKFSITRDLFPYLYSLDVSYSRPGFEWKVTDRIFLRNLKRLYLYGTQVSLETYQEMLRSAFAVEYLWLAGMTEWLYQGLVEVACRMPALDSLDLTSNDIHFLNDTLLQPCSQLTELTLSGNVMVALSDNSLKPLNQLLLLELDHNFLPKVPTAVRGLSKLSTLDLTSNDIGELGCSDFKNLTKLIRLVLQSNRISVLRACSFQDLNRLTYLNLYANPVYALHDSFTASLPHLLILNMSMNSLVSLGKHIFRGIPDLVVLDVRSTKFLKVENETFYGLHHLKTLAVATYSLNKDEFRGMPNLEDLTVHLPLYRGLNQQVNHDPPFTYLPILVRLSLFSSNKYTVFITPDLLKGLCNLKHFAAVQFFPGEPHPDTFSYTPNLTSLQITGSRISDPELLKPLPNLQTLDLSNNRIKSLDVLAQTNLSALRWLSLSDNELTVINETVLQSLPALKYLNLLGNPFTCDCFNIDFINWVKNNNQTQVVNAYKYTCYFPPSLQGTKLLEFDHIESCKMDLGFLYFIYSTSLVLLTLLTSFIYNFLRWQIVYAYYLFLAFLYDRRNKRKRSPHLYDAFISYNVNDEAWVYREMLPVLEGEQGWRLCLHHRDFQPGKPIIENITDAIYSSRKTICVISQSYLQSEWCSREFQMASFRLFDEQKDVLILLFLEEIPDQLLPPYYLLRKLVKKRTYLSWPQDGQHHMGVFWEKVWRALETGDALEDSNLLPVNVDVNI